MNIPLVSRRAVSADANLLGELVKQLVEDEGNRNPATVAQLQDQMRTRLAGEYIAVIFKLESEVMAYALYREEEDLIYLRQFFVQRFCRRKSIGQEAINILRSLYWPPGKRLTVEVLIHNAAALAFYRTLGFTDYSLTLERPAAQ